MTQLIQLLITIFLFLYSPPVHAQKLNVEEFISTYDPAKNYNPATEPVVDPIRGINVLEQGTGIQPTTSLPSSYAVSATLTPVLAYYVIPGQYTYGNISLISKLGYFATETLRKTVPAKKLQQLANIAHAYFCNLSQSCVQETVQTIIKPAMVLAREAGMFSKFNINPFSELIPEKVREVYTWDTLWNPGLFPNTFLQCTTFVAMVYNLNNISLQGRIQGDAREWIYNTDTFKVYRSGSATSSPEVLDTVVWADQGRNHVGIIVEKDGSKLRVLNANSDKTEYWYQYHRNIWGNYTITDLEGRTSVEAWVPSHWLRVKE